MFASKPGVQISIIAVRCIAEQITGSCRTIRLPELSGNRRFSRGSGMPPALENQIAFHSSAWLTMSYGKHGRFDDTCQDKRPRMKKRHPCRFKVEPLAIGVETRLSGNHETPFSESLCDTHSPAPGPSGDQAAGDLKTMNYKPMARKLLRWCSFCWCSWSGFGWRCRGINCSRSCCCRSSRRCGCCTTTACATSAGATC